jgi:hypothetical protein
MTFAQSDPRPIESTGPAMPPRRRATKPVKARQLTFAQDPSRLIEELTPILGAAKPSHVVRIVRPDDLVVLEIRCFGLQLVKSGRHSVLAPTGNGANDAYLVVGYTFQHIGEQAFLETASPATTETPFMPVSVLVAEPSRLAYNVAADEQITYSVAGILEALSRLPLRVAPLATPRPQPLRFPILDPVLTLPSGVTLAQAESGLVLAGKAAPATATTDALIDHARAMRVARTLLATTGALDLVDHVQLGDAVARPVPRPRPTRQKPRRPRPDETAVEAPWRLVISPSEQGGFAHVTDPAAAPADANRVELWHSRLGVRRVAKDGTVSIDERDDPQRAIRAIWARDMDGALPAATDDVTPFRTSLNGQDRTTLVTESADPTITTPQPVDAKRMYLSSQGAWLDLHGSWDQKPYSQAHVDAIDSWDHIAPMGRDQYVKVTYPGYLFPFGHRCSLIKVTERRIDAGGAPIAYLYQRFFIVVRQPVHYYSGIDMPFTQVTLRPIVTPNLDDPGTPGTQNVIQGADLFWPTVGGDKFEYTLDCLDQDGRRVLLQAPLLFVGAILGRNNAEKNLIRSSYTTPDSGPDPRGIPTLAQSVALATSAKPGDTAFETATLRFTGDPGNPGDLDSVPHLSGAVIVVPAMKKLAPQSDPIDVHYAQPYLQHGFAGVNADPQVFLELDTMSPISFGDGSPAASTEKSGGFLQPDIPVRGLSRALGTVGQVGSLVNPPAGKQPFDPLTYLDGVLPKLFGLFSLVDILQAVGLDGAPKFVTETLDEIASMLADLQSLSQALTDGVAQLTQAATDAPTAPLKQAAADAKTALDGVTAAFEPKFAELTDAISALTSSGDADAFTAAATAVLADLGATLTTLDQQVKTVSLPPVAKAQLERLVAALAPLKDVTKIADRIGKIVAFVRGLDPSNLSVKASFEWRPKLQNFPADKGPDDALFYVDPDGLLLSIEARASGQDGVGVDVLAQLSNFGLNLFEDTTLIKIQIDRLAFRASNGRKPEVDVVMRDMAWQGVLSFIQTLEALIPSDGFSDPPYVDVSSGGVKAGFDLALPSVAVGVFSLENISLGADVNVPFLGDAVTVGFNFCTREKPFRLTVLCVGGGGFVGLRLSPKGLVLLEMSLEACAQLAIDLGVASGSVSISVGVYLRLEGHDGSLTGYFRIRGEVDVLGLISASITLELSLTYDFGSGKLTGRASISIEISIFFFSFSVEVSCQRTLAGSNNDPTFAAILGITDDGTVVPDPGAPDGGVPAWTQYCAAFAEV